VLLHRTEEAVLLELKLKLNLMAREAQLKLQYFGHVQRESAGESALTRMKGSMEGTRRRASPRKQ